MFWSLHERNNILPFELLVPLTNIITSLFLAKTFEELWFRDRTTLIIVGKDSENYKFSNGIRFIGPKNINIVHSIMQQVDGLINTSIEEGMSSSILEAMKITPTSMIDISDGLSSEVLHISKCSNVGITIYENKIPIDHTVMNLASDFRMNPIVCALSGGEDYELLFTV